MRRIKLSRILRKKWMPNISVRRPDFVLLKRKELVNKKFLLFQPTSEGKWKRAK